MLIFLTILFLLILISLLVFSLLKEEGLLKPNPQTSLTALLPGLNCYQCGYISCNAYAEALCNRQETLSNLCRHQNIFDKTRFSNALRSKGYSVLRKNTDTVVAQVLCQGGTNTQQQEIQYDGLKRCQAVYALTLSTTHCTQGCLGLGDCLAFCPERAISLTENGLAQVNKEQCTGCGLCLKMCPTGVLQLVPNQTPYYVACNASLKYNQHHNDCTKRCTGCNQCVQQTPLAGFNLKNNLSSLHYFQNSNPRQIAQAASQCPSGSIILLGENGEFLNPREKDES